MQNDMIAQYETFLKLTETMIDLAGSEQWDVFTEQEESFSRLSDSLPPISVDVAEITTEPDRLFDLAGKIVENISTLREMTEQRKNSLQDHLNGFFSQKKVHLKYSEFSDQAIESRLLKDLFK